MFKKLFTNSFIYGLGPQVPKVVSVLVLPFITEFLTPEDYGIYGIITAYMASLVAFSILGM
ncbi:MAG: lipopolysaccharide biosynthesis protein, partial [Flavobacteriales bacterium]